MKLLFSKPVFSGYLMVGLLLVCFCGCGDGLIAVSGVVTCDGKPLDDGSIMFSLVDRHEPIYATTITNGKYSVRTEPGKMIVRIYGRRYETGKNPMARPAMQGPSTELEKREVLFLPKQYNTATKLTAEVTASSRKFDFTVEDDGSTIKSYYNMR